MEDYLGDLLTSEEYERLKGACAGETERLKELILARRAEQKRQAETLGRDNPWLKAFGGLDVGRGLTSGLAHSLIQRITVHENDRVEVTLQYRDEKEQLLTAADAGEVVA